MTPLCSKCQGIIAQEDISVANDVAFCRSCNAAYKLSELVHQLALDSSVDFNNPPPGAWYRNTGDGVGIGATHRSAGFAIVMLCMSLFWNGIISIFVALAVSSSLNLMGIPKPDWFPIPQMNDAVMGVGITIFLWIFLTPFIAIGLLFLALFLMALGGKTEVRLHGGEGVIFTGMGSLGWRRRFSILTVDSVKIENRRWRDSDGDRQSKMEIVLRARDGKPIKFGSGLTEARMKFLASALRISLAGRV